MTTLKQSDLYATGLAIFAMFFGAGNIIFPLALGHLALDQTPYAMIGLLITAVLLPFAGLLTMFLYNGDVRAFFGRLGRLPGLALAFFIIALLGPFGSTPRCIALAYSTFKLSFPDTSLPLFSLISCMTVFLLSYKKNRLLDILGYLLTPLLLLLLALIVVLGMIYAPSSTSVASSTGSEMFWHGLKEGYNTMDLLAAIFFAPIIIAFTQQKTAMLKNSQDRLKFILKASGIGAFLLSIVYMGFSFIAFSHANEMPGVPADQLLAALALKILGPQAGLIVCLTVVLACLTTAIALITAFTEFTKKDIFKEKLGYLPVLIGSLVLTFSISIFEFQGISQFLSPVLEICYPILIVLTAFNLYGNLYRLQLLTEEVQNP